MPEQPSRPRNPYIAGNPVGNSRAFVGRGDILRAVHRVIRDPELRGVVLHGQRRIGKTSILEHLVTSLRSEASGAYRPVYFDLQDKAKWPLGEVLVDQARGIAAALDLPAPVAEGDPAVWFQATWLPSVLAGLPVETSLVILLDEFDVLADVRSEQAASALFPYLRQLLDESGGRVRFIFVIGRNIDDLANIAHALFKSLPAERVGLLAREDAETLMRMSESNGSMRWDAAAIEAAWTLTSGHPFLIQKLCWELWERLHDDIRAGAQATAKDVEQAASRTLDSARNIFEWLWKGLPPAERVVAAALASAGARAISRDALEQILHESGVRVVIRELRDAPQILEDWDLIEPAEGGYRFRVELLRRWIAKTKPLSRVQKELDFIEPMAEQYYGTAELVYKQGDLPTATKLLRQALGRNPNHLRANELLVDILIAGHDWEEARRLLEQLHQDNPAVVRGRLVQVLMELADAAANDEERLGLLDRVLKVQKHPAAEAARRRIWMERGDQASGAGKLEDAVAAYREAGDAKLEKAAKDQLRQAELGAGIKEVDILEQREAYAAAYDKLRQLSEEFSDVKDWRPELARLERAAYLDGAYRRAVDARARGEREIALRALLEVIGCESAYRDATAQLHQLVTGVDVDGLVLEVTREQADRVEAERKAEREKKQRGEAEVEAHRRIQARMFVIGFSCTILVAAFIIIFIIYGQLQSAKNHWAEVGHELDIVSPKLDVAKTEMKTIMANLDETQTTLHVTSERLREETERRRRLLEKGPLEVEHIGISASLLQEQGVGCVPPSRVGVGFELKKKFPANGTCYVHFQLILRNNAVNMGAPQGHLCIKYVLPDGKTSEGDASHSPPPQGGPCTMGFPLNIPGTAWQLSEKVDIDAERITLSNSWGKDDGSSYSTQIGIHRIEIWWQNNKIGEGAFEIVQSSSLQKPFLKRIPVP